MEFTAVATTKSNKPCATVLIPATYDKNIIMIMIIAV